MPNETISSKSAELPIIDCTLSDLISRFTIFNNVEPSLGTGTYNPPMLTATQVALDKARNLSRVKSRWPKIFNRLLRPQNKVNNALIETMANQILATEIQWRTQMMELEALRTRIGILETKFESNASLPQAASDGQP